MFIAVLFTIAKTWKQPECSSTDEWIKKMWYNGNITQPNKEWHNAIVPTGMDLEIILLSEVSQRQRSHDITYMWNLKYDTNEPIYETETESWT